MAIAGCEIASKTSYNVKVAIAGCHHERGVTFGSRCLDLGTVIAGKTSLSVTMATAGRMCDCGPTSGSNDKMAAAGRQPLPWHRNRWQDIGQRQDGRCRPTV